MINIFPIKNVYLITHYSTLDSNPWVYCIFISLWLSNKLILPTEIHMKWNEATPSLLKTIRLNSLNICLWDMFFSDSVIPLSRAMCNILSELQMPDLDIIFLLELQHYETLSKASILISTQNSLFYSVIHIFPWSLLLAASCSLDSKMLILVSNPLQKNTSLPHSCRL